MRPGLPRSVFASLLPLLALIVGCSFERYEGGGGFETPDLTARVVDTAGKPVFGARVWLVKSNGDSAPASVLDSTQTDSTGFVGFSMPKGENRIGLGLDALERERMGIAPSAFRYSDETRLELRDARSIQADRDSTGALPELHVPGSHFSSRQSANGSSSTLRVPSGVWDVAIKRGTSLTILKSLPILSDTILPVASVSVPQDTSTRIELADSADITLDSFRIWGIKQYVEASFHSTESWILSPFRYNQQSTIDSIGIRLNSNWVDSATRQGISELFSPLLPDTGTLAIQLAFPGGIDTSIACRMTLYDSTTQANIRVIAGSDLDSIGAFEYQYPRPASFIPIDAPRFASDNIWYFSWTRDSLVIRTSNGLRGRSAVPNKFSGSMRFAIMARAKKQPSFASMWIKNVRLYTPK